MPQRLKPAQLSLIQDSSIDLSGVHTLKQAIGLCMATAGYTLDKEVADAVGMSTSALSKWKDNVDKNWAHMQDLMTVCNSEIPLLWMVNKMAYDISALRKKETELERQLRLKEEELAKERMEHQAALSALRKIMVGQAS